MGKITGLLWGEAVGDAVGLPREGLSPQRAKALFGEPPLKHALVWGRGMISDDTEHACMVGQALLAAPDDPKRFARSLAWRLRGWLWGLPAGIGWATGRAILKLCLGFPPERSGVHSAGNGPAMRAPLLGVCFADDLDKMKAYIRASTRLTHTDEKAYHGALAIALAAQQGVKLGPEGVDVQAFFALLRAHVEGEELWASLDAVETALLEGKEPQALAQQLGWERGVSGYINHTVPACLYCWLRHLGDLRAAIEEVIMLGGDADTTGAITGAIAGATCGPAAIPQEWLDAIIEWPRSISWIKRLAARLETRFEPNSTTSLPQAPTQPLPLFWPGLLLRNPFFFCVALLHGFRRLFPPYS